MSKDLRNSAENMRACSSGEASGISDPIVIERDPHGFTVRHGDRSCDGLCWDEMLGQVVNLTLPNGGGRLYRMLSDAERATEEARGRERAEQVAARRRAVIAVEYPIEGARRLNLDLADILCWAAGFRAARPDDPSNHPMGIHAVREFRDVLSRAIEQASTDEQ
ncbi:hypothetical protein [Ancylobacter amanitiformis]|uniref:Uncharacterized protein n=1 Tax=Ancylobacter amanitiformis TaxID=217069 RepID=A0ABU0LQE7_9HYPH|nr:hypothetical protein [Ancylobacter amanitiformis]MDQ0510934.1 hypothetical protein [Ancylobacter amanitiformis]